MSGIPDDVLAAAKRAAYAVEGTHEDGWITSSNGVDVIARAILAERERCAKVVKFIRENAAKMSVSERDDVWLNLMDRVAEGIELGVQF